MERRGDADCFYVYHLHALFLLKRFQRMRGNVVLCETADVRGSPGAPLFAV